MSVGLGWIDAGLPGVRTPGANGLEQFLVNLTRLSRAVGALQILRNNLGLRSPCSLRPRLAYAGPSALNKLAPDQREIALIGKFGIGPFFGTEWRVGAVATLRIEIKN